MRDAGNHNSAIGVMDNVQHTVVADAHPPLVVEPNQLPRARGPRLIAEAVDSGVDSLTNIRRKSLQVACGGGSDENGISHGETDPSSLEALPGDAVSRLGERALD